MTFDTLKVAFRVEYAGLGNHQLLHRLGFLTIEAGDKGMNDACNKLS